MNSGVWGPNQDTAINGLRGAIKTWYEQHPAAHKIQGKITHARIKTSNDWPKMRAKAAATRHALEFALQLADQHNSGSLHDRRRLACCKLLNRFYVILNENDRYASEEA